MAYIEKGFENMFSDWVRTCQISYTEVKQLSFRMVGGRGGRVYVAQMTLSQNSWRVAGVNTGFK
ncbi:hypothetical protein T4D_14293 [Trichinella pseudospiralis]|uniref:Uncharacterized protein n=1 Tax=Trichinella pseudospiralis TaxID=6337 RepID=A0A0V1F4B4_TRIPS|nr:hypothetical protein T4D_14293 [Trichinella pseudospiralis]